MASQREDQGWSGECRTPYFTVPDQAHVKKVHMVFWSEPNAQ